MLASFINSASEIIPALVKMAHPIVLPVERQRSMAADPDEALFPSLVAWRDAKIRDLSYCLATFFNYLALPRNGFLEVSRAPGTMSTLPVISLDMCQYVLKEIFPCPAMTREEAFAVFRVPKDFEAAITETITEHITNQSFFTPMRTNQNILTYHGAKTVKMNVPTLELQPGVVQTIWTWVSNGVDSLAYGSESDEEVRSKIEEAEAATLAKRNAIRNYGFNDELENSAFQALLYIMVAFSDWLETEEIGRAEVEYAYRLIVPPDLQRPLTRVKNMTLTEIITMAIVGVDLTPTDEAVELLSSAMVEVKDHMERLQASKPSRKVINRYMGFSQPV
jgi:hypothetical protein